MNLVNSPISLSQTGVDVKNLQEVLSFLLREKVFNIDDFSLINSLADEYANQLYGMATASLVKQFAFSHGISESDGFEVDDTISAALNAALAGVAPAPQYTITGRIKHPSGFSVNASYPVKLYQLTYSGNVSLGQVNSAANGSYSISFDANALLPGNTPGFKTVATIAELNYESETIYTTATEIVLDINIADNTLSLTTEYEEVTEALARFVTGPFENIDTSINNADSDLSRLVQATGESQQCIVAMATAHKIAVTQLGDIDIELTYALFRQGITTNLEALLFEPDTRLINAINLSVVNYIIGSKTTTEIDNFIAALKVNIVTRLINYASDDVAESALKRIIDMITGNNLLTLDFMYAYADFVNNKEADLWTSVASVEGLTAYIPAFKAALSLALLTGNNPALFKRFYNILKNTPLEGDPNISVPDAGNPKPALLTGLSQAQIQAIVTAGRTTDPSNFFYPDYVTGTDTTEKDEDYAARIYRNFSTAFPADMINHRIATDNGTAFTQLKSSLGSFMETNEHFDLRSTSILDLKKEGAFNFEGITNQDAFIEETGAMQRLLNLTNNYDLLNAMATDGITSSIHVVQQPYHQFEAAYATVSGASANDTATLYSNAYSNYTLVQVIAMTQYTDFTKGITVIDKRSYNPEEAFADWRSLFGSLDTCTCASCTSVFSPSAYLVDTLNFFKTQAADAHMHDGLIQNRRPDIKDIELSCKNTNTLVPHIDMVNEMLEDLVSSVNKGIVASNQPGSNALNMNGAYKMYARQTVADQSYQRAIPEYVNTDQYTATFWNDATDTTATATIDSPYPILKDSIAPWALPYNFYKRQIDTHLGIAGIKTHELIQRFSSLSPLNAWNDSGFLTAYLGLSQEQYTLLMQDSYGGGWTPWIPYNFFQADPINAVKSIPDPAKRGTQIGGITHGSWKVVMAGRIDVFLQQTGLNFKELLTILDCYWLNPLSGGTRHMNIVPHTGTDVNTCDLSLLKLTGFDSDSVTQDGAIRTVFHRFVRGTRFWKWTFYEMDRALVSFNAFQSGSTFQTLNDGIFKQLAQLKRVTELLSCSVEDALVLYSEINTATYRDYSKTEPADLPSQYARIFRNPLLTTLKDVAYPFPEDPAMLTSSTAPDVQYPVFINYLSGVLNISVAELDTLLQQWTPGSTVKPVLSFTTSGNQISLSAIYREVIIMKGLHLTATEWLFYKHYITDTSDFGQVSSDAYESVAAPFNSPYDTIRFESFVSLYKTKGFTKAIGLYLMNDLPANSIEDDNLTTKMTTAIQELQLAMKQRMWPDYDENTDTEGTKLQLILEQLMERDLAAKLVDIVQRPYTTISPATPSYTTGEHNFIINDLSFLFSADTLTQSIPPTQTMADRRYFVFSNVKKYIRENVLKPFLVSFISKQTGFNESITDLLLGKCILIGSSTGYDILLDDIGFITQTTTINRWDSAGNVTATYNFVYSTFILLQKATLLIEQFGLDYTDIDYLWNKIVFSDFPKLSDLPIRYNKTTSTTGAVKYRNLLVMLRWMQVRKFVGTNMVALYSALSNIVNKANTETQLAAVFAMPEADIIALLGDGNNYSPSGIFNLSFGSNYFQPNQYLRIIDCLEIQHLLPATMQSLGNARTAAIAPGSQSNASTVTQIVKAQYDDATWLQTIKPVNDVLRIERRDAMIAWLLCHPPAGYEYKWLAANDIFETLMVDVEMSPCMSTTRVVLATNTAQLWADRVLLGLEKWTDGSLITMTKSMSRQWRNWRKWYRVWEANRKIFLYPENWIEPELRDGKSPFFEELEKYLKQNEVTQENVEAAYRTYLDRLDEVAHLDIIGLYRGRGSDTNYTNFDAPNDDIVHVFGRTRTNPHIYYYRKRVAYEWTPWEKIDIKIESEHFIPMVWRGRLRLYWLVFTKDQQADDGGRMRSNKLFIPPTPVRWKIELAWTELKDGKWTTMQMSKDPLYTEWMRASDPANKAQIDYFVNGDWQDIYWSFSDGLERLKKEWLNVYAEYDLDGNIKIMLRHRLYDINNGRLYDETCKSTGEFYNLSIDDTIAALKKFGYTDPKRKYKSGNSGIYNSNYYRYTGHFLHKYNGVTAVSGSAITGEDTTQSDYFYEDWLQNTQGEFSDYAHYKAYAIEYTRYRYADAASLGYNHYPDDGNHTGLKLLGYCPDINDIENQGLDRTDKYKEGKYVIYPREVPKDYTTWNWISVPYFFYRDYKNQFFVEHTKVEERVQVTFNLFPPSSDVSVVSITKGIDLTRYWASDAISVAKRATRPNSQLYAYNLPQKDLPATKSTSVFDGKLSVYTTRMSDKYRFHNFIYEKVDDLKNVLYLYGLDGLLDRSFITGLTDTIYFPSKYAPTSNVDSRHPVNSIDFAYDSAYAIYNWELFYHIPLLIANKLSQNQQFEEARSWYHYVFNPTVSGTSSIADFWNFPEFYNNATNVPSPTDVLKDQNLAAAVDAWANDPFKPHLVARTRISAYMKNTVMKYLDNLIAWGDYLFTQNTRESINEATMLYVLAAQIMGRAPETTPARAKSAVYTYAKLSDQSVTGGLNAFGEAMVAIESLLLPSGTISTTSSSTALGSMFYFCIPPNDKLYGYWDIIADRLFKIHNCQNISGVVQELALFAPPIDPALLVKAAASGISIADAVAGLNAPLPFYRFNVIAQKATEIAQEVKSLGGQLLAALEKKDAEAIALLRSSQEITLLEAVTDIKNKQVDEAAAQIVAMNQQKVMTTTRRDYYKNLISNGLSVYEQLQLTSATSSLTLQTSAALMHSMAGGLALIPHLIIGAFSFGAGIGGESFSKSISKAGDALNQASGILNSVGSTAGIKGGYERRKQEWEFQAKVADAELVQIDKQIAAAEIRKAIADVELQNHTLQTEQTRTMKDAMESKYTNEELYDWMIGQIGTVYYQGYKLAMDTARKAERCFRYELGLSTSDYIQSGYWDSMKKGLLAAEQLVYDIKRMEAGYLDKNKRQMELTKHVSLAALDPDKLMELRLKKSCDIEIPEWLYDLDYPGQYMRRIKSVSISIPCVAGPYTTVSCKLSMTSSRYRINDLLTGGVYEEAVDDPRFNYLVGNIQSIATSSAQNDSGMFEFNFRDERYLPFEGAGAVSNWKIELPAAAAQFDYNSIADVILHVKYTALDGGNTVSAASAVTNRIKGAITNQDEWLYRMFDLKHEFPDAWHELLYGSHQMDLEQLKQRLPYLVQTAGSVTALDANIILEFNNTSHNSGDNKITLSQNSTDIPLTTGVRFISGDNRYWKYTFSPNFDLSQKWSLKTEHNVTPATPLTATELMNAWLVIKYKALP